MSEDLGRRRIFFRKLEADENSVDDRLKQDYLAAVGTPGPVNVKAGYLYWDWKDYGNSAVLRIRPVRGEVIRVAETEEWLRTLRGDSWARDIQVTEEPKGSGRWAADPRGNMRQSAGDGYNLLITGRPASRKDAEERPHHHYLFPPADRAANYVELSREDQEDLEEDARQRRNMLRGMGYDPQFWALPRRPRSRRDRSEEKPVFYLAYNGHIYVSRSRYPRIGYKGALADGLPPAHIEAAEQMDYARAILGFVAGKTSSYRSRVSFGDLAAEGDPRPMETLRLLAEPKPSYFPGYVAEGKHYNEEDFRLRGYKQYWFKDPPPSAVANSRGSLLRPLPAGTRFSGTVRFRNLNDAELGLLLWALRLEEGCFQPMGMGKPYGYGRMVLTIDSLTEFRPDRLYGGDLTAGGERAADPAAAVERYIDSFKALLADEDPRDRAAREDLFFLRRTVVTGESGFRADYMSIRRELPDGDKINEFKDAQGPLPTVAQLRERGKQA